MATPRKRDPRQSSQRLLEAGVEAFAEYGPRAPTVERISQLAGMNKRMIYHYFGSKQALYQEALRCVYDRFLSLEVSLTSMLLPPEKMLESLVRRYYEFLAEHPSFVRLIAYENLNRGRVARRLKLTGQKAPIITALRAAMRAGQAHGKFRGRLDVNQLLISIFGLCFFYFSNQYTMKEFLGPGGLPRRRLARRVRHVVDLLLYGVSARGPRRSATPRGAPKGRA
jgi:TetR/AcrR family transcriptional regulator